MLRRIPRRSGAVPEAVRRAVIPAFLLSEITTEIKKKTLNGLTERPANEYNDDEARRVEEGRRVEEERRVDDAGTRTVSDGPTLRIVDDAADDPGGAVPAPVPPDDPEAWYAPAVRAQYESASGVVATVRERDGGLCG